MSGEIPSLSPYKGKAWTEWTNTLAKTADYLSEMVETEPYQSVRLLPRRDFMLYGTCPKMDVRVLCHCEKCGKVMMPQAFFENHQKVKHGPEQPIILPVSSSSSKKKNSHSKNKKKSAHAPPPPPLFPKTPTPPSTPPIQIPIELPPPVLQPIQATKTLTTPPPPPLPPPSPSNSRHKKSKKNSKKVKDFDPEKHCGAFEGNKGPCLKSIGCTIHLTQIKKTVSGRSKDGNSAVQQPSDNKITKEKEVTKNLSTHVTNIPNIVDPVTTTSQCNSLLRSIATTYVKIAQAPPPTMTTANTDQPVISQALQVSISPCTTTATNCQGKVSPSSVVYMPMSPVAVVSPVQFVQLGGPLLRVASTQSLLSPPLATQPIVVTIPVPTSTCSVYAPHPKPLSISSCTARKIGGALVLQNQRIERQRNEIQIAANTRRINSACSLLNTHHHRPNILKNSARNNVKIGTLKRPASDKLVTEGKQIRISTDGVNGFILHTEVSEAADAPQNNNSVHEKITFLNMKLNSMKKVPPTDPRRSLLIKSK